MTVNRSALRVTLAMLSLVAAVASATEADNPMQWQVANDDKVSGNVEYGLFNLRRQTLNLSSQLGARWQDVCTFPCFGAPDEFQLTWLGTSGGYFVFVRRDSQDRNAIAESEVVAIYNTKTKRYLTTSMGYRAIIEPSTAPAYEWALHGRRGTDFALYNTRVGGYLMLKDTYLTFGNCSGSQSPQVRTDPSLPCDTNWRAAIATTTPTQPPTQTPTTPPAVGPRAVIRTGAGLCLDVHAPEIATNGGRVQVWACHGQPNQLWTYDRTNGTLRVPSGLCLDVNAPEMKTNGGRVQVWACSGQPQQQWLPLPNGTIRNRGGLCLDVHAPDQFKNGARVQVWACGGEQQQRFVSEAFNLATVVPPPQSPAPSNPSGSADVPAEARQWNVANSDTVLGNEQYGLFNLRRKELNLTSQLGSVRRDGGYFGSAYSDFSWAGTRGGYFVFLRPNVNDRRPLSDLDAVAIYNTSAKGYLKGRGFITSIEPWSSRPEYEWIVRGRVGSDFALYNVKAEDYLVLNERSAPGIRAYETLTYRECARRGEHPQLCAFTERRPLNKPQP